MEVSILEPFSTQMNSTVAFSADFASFVLFITFVADNFLVRTKISFH